MQNIIFLIKSHLKKMLLKIKKKKNHNIRLVNLKYWLKKTTKHYYTLQVLNVQTFALCNEVNQNLISIFLSSII